MPRRGAAGACLIVSPQLPRRGEKPETFAGLLGHPNEGLHLKGCDMSELQTRLDRIERWDTFSIDWQYFRELAALQAMDLCALSVGLHPEYARLIDEMLSVDLRASHQ